MTALIRADTTQRMLQELFGIALILHGLMVFGTLLLGHTIDAMFVWESFFGVLAAAALLGLRLQPMRELTLAVVYCVMFACILRWTSAWWGNDPYHLYTTIVSVGLYFPLLMLTSAPLKTRGSLWIACDAALAFVAALACTRPQIQATVFSDARLSPVILLTTILFVRYLERWQRHIGHIRESQIREEALEEAARTDGLTGLLNRQGIELELEQHAQRHAYWSVLLVDVDHFKGVNDEHGHLVGDQCLRNIARYLEGAVRASDLVARWGGEEFLVLLPDAQLPGANKVAEKLCSDIRLRSEAESVVTLTVSIGAAEHRHDETYEQTMNRADQALYQAKRNGRDRWEAAE